MSAFVFKLQPILDLRSHLEKEQKDQFAAETGKLNHLLAQKAEWENAYGKWAERYLCSAAKGISPEEAVSICRYLEELRLQIQRTEIRIAEQDRVVEQARLELIEKMKDRKVIEALKKKQYQRYLEEQQKKQEKSIEEFVISRTFA